MSPLGGLVLHFVQLFFPFILHFGCCHAVSALGRHCCSGHWIPASCRKQNLCSGLQSHLLGLVCSSLYSVLLLFYYFNLHGFWGFGTVSARRRGKLRAPTFRCSKWRSSVLCVCSCTLHSLHQTGTDWEDHPPPTATAFFHSRCDGNDDGMVCGSGNQEQVQFSCGSLPWNQEVILNCPRSPIMKFVSVSSQRWFV